MIHDEVKAQRPGLTGDQLEPYRRMVEMQRQIIELVKKHEQSKREYEQLRHQVAHEIDMFCSPQQGWFSRLRKPVVRLRHQARLLGLRVKRAIETSEMFPSSQQSTEI